MVEYRLCKEFGWTPKELGAQNWDKIEMILNIMNIEAQFQEKKERLAQSKNKTWPKSKK